MIMKFAFYKYCYGKQVFIYMMTINYSCWGGLLKKKNQQ